VYLPAIAGHVPSEMVKAIAALIEFCYLVRRNVIDESALAKIKSTLDRVHSCREIFRELGVRPDGFSLPRQHSLVHYAFAITQFGAPNGLCSSITESKHIKAIKRPYRRSNRNKPLGQMLVTNQRIDKITAARTYFKTRGMLNGPSSIDGLLSDLSNHEGQATRLDPASSPHTVPPVRVGRATGSSGPDRGNNTENDDRDLDRECLDSRPEDDPEAIAEIKLARTYSACLFHFFCL
jgi:hypothetical protein